MKMMTMNRQLRSPSTSPGQLPFHTRTNQHPNGCPLPPTLSSMRAPLLRLARVDAINVARQPPLARICAVPARLMPSALSAIAPAPEQAGHASIVIQAMTSVATQLRQSTRVLMPTTDVPNADPALAGCARFLAWNRLLFFVTLPLGRIAIPPQPR
jgi:hypothetical protein